MLPILIIFSCWRRSRHPVMVNAYLVKKSRKFTLISCMIGYSPVKSPRSQLGLFLGLLGISFVVGYLILGIIGFSLGLQDQMVEGKLDWSRPEVLSAMKIMQAVSSLLIFLLPAFTFAHIVNDGRPSPFLGLKKAGPKQLYLLAAGGIILAFPFVFWLGELNHLLPLPKWMGQFEEDATKQMLQFLKADSVGDVILNVIIIAFLPALCEEVCFRGALQRIMIHLTKSPWTGIIVTSVLFSALHLQFYGFLPRMFLGVFLGAIYWYSGSLWPSILAHFVYNAIQVVAVSYMPKYIEQNPPVPVMLALASGLIVFGIIWLSNKFSTNTYKKVYEPEDVNRNNEFPV